MASSLDFAEYVMEQLNGAGTLRYRKMFGEYCIYVNDKPIVLVCDDRVFVKIIPELADIMIGAERGFPYEGAKERYLLDIDDRDLTLEVIRTLDKVTPKPKKRQLRA